jgi:hypothetical protein
MTGAQQAELIGVIARRACRFLLDELCLSGRGVLKATDRQTGGAQQANEKAERTDGRELKAVSALLIVALLILDTVLIEGRRLE